jgi:1,4-dihydroxy-2-naphthoate octaprenyltransferase
MVKFMATKHSIKDWVIATRPWSFPASAMPVLVTLGYLFWSGHRVDWITGILTILNVVLFHAAGNTWSDYKDYKSGVDREDTVGGLSIVSGQFKPQEIKKLSLALFAIAVAGGLALTCFTGITTLYFGLAGALLTIFYPWLKYRALGDLDIFLTYSVVPMLGTSFVATGEIHLDALVLSVPVGLITVGILHSNNTRDIEQDRRAGIKTFAMCVGGKVSTVLYCLEMLVPFVWVIVCTVLDVLPGWSILVIAAAKMAFDNARQALRYNKEGMKALVGVDEKTAQLQLAFSVLMFVSFITAALW